MGEVMPNVRVEAGSRASHRARASENIQRTTGRAWRLAVRPRLERGVSVVIGLEPQTAPKKHGVVWLWQSGMRCRKRPIQQWCILPAG